MLLGYTKPVWKEKELCAFCSRHKVHQLAEEIEPGVMINGHWVDGYTKDKVNKMRTASAKAEEQLKKPCLCFCDDDAGGYEPVCADCLEGWMKERIPNGTEDSKN